MQRAAELLWISVAARLAVLSECSGLPNVGAVIPLRARALSEATERFGASARSLRHALSTLCHLALRGWRVTVDRGRVSVRRKGVRLRPRFAADPKVQRDTERVWASIGLDFMKLCGDHRFPDAVRIGEARERLLTNAVEQLGEEQESLRQAVSVLCHLVARGWCVWVVGGQVFVERKRLRLRPRFAIDPEDQCEAEQFWASTATQLSRLPDKDGLPDAAAIGSLRTRSLSQANACFGKQAQSVRLAVSILCDLALQGWRTEVTNGQASIYWPNPNGGRSKERQRARAALVIARDEQLGESAVRAFVRSMETRRQGPEGWHSIYSLMRDGAELASALSRIDAETPEEAQLQQLRRVIRPYLQFVTEDARCERTGLRLADVWRYFRYTWLTPARSTPGRTMMVLVRDAAVEPHPVIGIAALASSIVQQRCRDEWIGWDRQSVLRLATKHPSDELANWLLRSLQELIDGVYAADFLEGGRLHPADLLCPHEAVVEQLREFGKEERGKHQELALQLNYRRQQQDDNWAGLAATPLYRSKRALGLAGLLEIRQEFHRAGLMDGTADQLAQASRSGGFREAVARLVRYIKATRVGINMMDISVAGALAPYNVLLGGKLVSVLLASPEVREAYSQRYGATQSVIASAMKGAAVVRQPRLVLLCTTGLFARGSSQYNRIRVPAQAIGGTTSEVRFQQLDEVTSYGTYHFSRRTLREMVRYVKQSHNGSGVHGIFGEGVNPKMRKIREGLDRLGFPSDELLQPGSARTVYVVPLAHNFREILLGRADEPDYVLPSNQPQRITERMVEFWRQRWLCGRIHRPGVLETVAEHVLSHPIIHGARVRLPAVEDIGLFDDPGEQLEFESLEE